MVDKGSVYGGFQVSFGHQPGPPDPGRPELVEPFKIDIRGEPKARSVERVAAAKGRLHLPGQVGPQCRNRGPALPDSQPPLPLAQGQVSVEETRPVVWQPVEQTQAGLQDEHGFQFRAAHGWPGKANPIAKAANLMQQLGKFVHNRGQQRAWHPGKEIRVRPRTTVPTEKRDGVIGEDTHRPGDERPTSLEGREGE